ncbi:hypothetical protein [Butyrivibrio proteoclasticus]|uniref:hypothetical protein n=1 Tax=Butyrivibrio proteoclasticus TaxID=43305 RepID=UPI000479E737|nr:hypothetical protein [Butyrivibrio proteoclasticus]
MTFGESLGEDLCSVLRGSWRVFTGGCGRLRQLRLLVYFCGCFAHVHFFIEEFASFGTALFRFVIAVFHVGVSSGGSTSFFHVTLSGVAVFTVRFVLVFMGWLQVFRFLLFVALLGDFWEDVVGVFSAIVSSCLFERVFIDFGASTGCFQDAGFPMKSFFSVASFIVLMCAVLLLLRVGGSVRSFGLVALAAFVSDGMEVFFRPLVVPFLAFFDAVLSCFLGALFVRLLGHLNRLFRLLFVWLVGGGFFRGLYGDFFSSLVFAAVGFSEVCSWFFAPFFLFVLGMSTLF